MMRRLNASALILATSLLTGVAQSQNEVSVLQELIGARGTAVDSLEQNGYTYRYTEKSADSSYSYWLEDASGRCVAARVTNGRVASIEYAGEPCVEPEMSLEPGYFRTVCGVILDDETYRYRCQAMDDTENGDRITVLRLPDNEMKFRWLDDEVVTIERVGLAAVQATYSIHEGETDVFTDEMTYFYISDRGMAEYEIRNFVD